MKITVLTFFPEIFKTYFETVAPFKKGIAFGLLNIDLMQIRDYTHDKHRRTDGYPFGGGAGLVLFCQPILDALHSIPDKKRILFTSPAGKPFNHKYAVELSQEEHLVFVAGRYEGYDKRIFDSINHEKISIGDYVLTGGEIAALAIIDSVSRQIPGVLDNEESLKEESFSSHFLEYDHYTRPREYEGLKVPEVLFSGHHGEIEKARRKWSLINTYENRPDLLRATALSVEDIEILKQHVKEKYRGY